MIQAFEEAQKIKSLKYFKDQHRGNGNGDKDHFIDPYFPPERSSLLEEDKITQHRETVLNDIKPDTIEWKRPKDIYEGGKFLLFEGKIETDDIRQGALQDCYFLSALAALTEFPELIHRIFESHEISEEGYYELNYFIDGEWQKVFIDDYLPVKKGTSSFCFSRTNGPELWVVLLEKAWAKVNGGYYNIILGEASDTFLCLTGSSYEALHLENEKAIDLWSKAKMADDSNYIICTATKNEEFVERKGLVKGHVYCLVAAKEKYYNSSMIQLLKLFNPWGKGSEKEWNGEWSDSSNLWDETLSQHFGRTVADDGSFFISLNDFQYFYSSLYICHLMYGARLLSFNTDPSVAMKPVYYIMDLLNDGYVSFNIFFKHWRFNRELFGTVRKFSLLVAQLDETNEVHEVDGSFATDSNDIYLLKELTKGKYIIWMQCLSPGKEKPEEFSYIQNIICKRL
jgi:hypothetical protein